MKCTPEHRIRKCVLRNVRSFYKHFGKIKLKLTKSFYYFFFFHFFSFLIFFICNYKLDVWDLERMRIPASWYSIYRITDIRLIHNPDLKNNTRIFGIPFILWFIFWTRVITIFWLNGWEDSVRRWVVRGWLLQVLVELDAVITRVGHHQVTLRGQGDTLHTVPRHIRKCSYCIANI